MQTYWPKDDEIFSWDPENMDKYWELCRKFDQASTSDLSTADETSQTEFQKMFVTKLR